MIFQAGWLSKRRALRNYGSLPVYSSEWESEGNIFYSDLGGQLTLKDEKEIMSVAVDSAKETILAELQSQHKELLGRFDTIDGTNQEIKRLQFELKEQTEAINELLIARKNAKRIYYTGLGTGIASGLAGLVYNNFLYIIVGIGIALTAITGLWEAKQNE